MNLVSNGLSVQCYLMPKMMGKVRRRVQEMRNPNTMLSSVDMSYNEITRLAMDALLDRGNDGSKEVLNKENEANFLSAEEKTYILNNIKTPLSDNEETDRDEEMSGSATVSSETYFPAVTESEPPVLDYGWPVADWSYHLQGIPSVEVFFHSMKSFSMKDMLRELIRQATKVLAIVMDTFSDVEIFCDTLEAIRKHNVSIYLLLEYTNLQLFQDIMSIRSVQGETYCAKLGREFTGQMKEKFIIVDCTKVLVGSYSLTWLSWQVHRSLAVLFKGSGVKPFDLEFRRLYTISEPIPGFTCHTSDPGDLCLALRNSTSQCAREESLLTNYNRNLVNPGTGVSRQLLSWSDKLAIQTSPLDRKDLSGFHREKRSITPLLISPHFSKIIIR
ncbi:protein FAM83A-like [Carassius gibelio]|uniref:protein FAM83A-like n=1 Tax=Carassius gibelio TaxID=101364 RepID=UPI002279A51D|nr:protein FAM83A-like [Carassius gibelio]